MYLLSLKDRRDDGAYAVLNRYGEKVLFMFEEEDDAERYAMMLEDTLFDFASLPIKILKNIFYDTLIKFNI